MAAVAGAVAEEMLAAMTAAAPLDRAYVNNGGDIALHSRPARRFAVGLVDRPGSPEPVRHARRIGADDPVRGIATSGWRGRSFSLGIADAVTVLAADGASGRCRGDDHRQCGRPAGHPAITRVPARDLQPDSDLGARLVTRDVGRPCRADEIDEALRAAVAAARGSASRAA